MPTSLQRRSSSQLATIDNVESDITTEEQIIQSIIEELYESIKKKKDKLIKIAENYPTSSTNAEKPTILKNLKESKYVDDIIKYSKQFFSGTKSETPNLKNIYDSLSDKNEKLCKNLSEYYTIRTEILKKQQKEEEEEQKKKQDKKELKKKQEEEEELTNNKKEIVTHFYDNYVEKGENKVTCKFDHMKDKTISIYDGKIIKFTYNDDKNTHVATVQFDHDNDVQTYKIPEELNEFVEKVPSTSPTFEKDYHVKYMINIATEYLLSNKMGEEEKYKDVQFINKLWYHGTINAINNYTKEVNIEYSNNEIDEGIKINDPDLKQLQWYDKDYLNERYDYYYVKTNEKKWMEDNAAGGKEITKYESKEPEKSDLSDFCSHILNQNIGLSSDKCEIMINKIREYNFNIITLQEVQEQVVQQQVVPETNMAISEDKDGNLDITDSDYYKINGRNNDIIRFKYSPSISEPLNTYILNKHTEINQYFDKPEKKNYFGSYTEIIKSNKTEITKYIIQYFYFSRFNLLNKYINSKLNTEYEKNKNYYTIKYYNFKFDYLNLDEILNLYFKDIGNFFIKKASELTQSPQARQNSKKRRKGGEKEDRSKKQRRENSEKIEEEEDTYTDTIRNFLIKLKETKNFKQEDPADFKFIVKTEEFTGKDVKQEDIKKKRSEFYIEYKTKWTNWGKDQYTVEMYKLFSLEYDNTPIIGSNTRFKISSKFRINQSNFKENYKYVIPKKYTFVIPKEYTENGNFIPGRLEETKMIKFLKDILKNLYDSKDNPTREKKFNKLVGSKNILKKLTKSDIDKNKLRINFERKSYLNYNQNNKFSVNAKYINLKQTRLDKFVLHTYIDNKIYDIETIQLDPHISFNETRGNPDRFKLEIFPRTRHLLRVRVKKIKKLEEVQDYPLVDIVNIHLRSGQYDVNEQCLFLYSSIYKKENENNKQIYIGDSNIAIDKWKISNSNIVSGKYGRDIKRYSRYARDIECTLDPKKTWINETTDDIKNGKIPSSNYTFPISKYRYPTHQEYQEIKDEKKKKDLALNEDYNKFILGSQTSGGMLDILYTQDFKIDDIELAYVNRLGDDKSNDTISIKDHLGILFYNNTNTIQLRSNPELEHKVVNKQIKYIKAIINLNKKKNFIEKFGTEQELISQNNQPFFLIEFDEDNEDEDIVRLFIQFFNNYIIGFSELNDIKNTTVYTHRGTYINYISKDLNIAPIRTRPLPATPKPLPRSESTNYKIDFVGNKLNLTNIPTRVKSGYACIKTGDSFNSSSGLSLRFKNIYNNFIKVCLYIIYKKNKQYLQNNKIKLFKLFVEYLYDCTRPNDDKWYGTDGQFNIKVHTKLLDMNIRRTNSSISYEYSNMIKKSHEVSNLTKYKRNFIGKIDPQTRLSFNFIDLEDDKKEENINSITDEIYNLNINSDEEVNEEVDYLLF